MFYDMLSVLIGLPISNENTVKVMLMMHWPTYQRLACFIKSKTANDF